MSSNFVEVIKACEQAEGGGSKLAIREALVKVDEIAYRLIWEANNIYRVYGVKQFDMPKSFAGGKGSSEFAAFFKLLDNLASRSLTGNAAREAVTAHLQAFDKETATYLARVLDKDLKAGFSADTFNHVLIARELCNEHRSAEDGKVEENMGIDLDSVLKSIKKLLKVKGIRQFEKLAVFPLLIPTFEVQLADKCETEEDYENIVYPCQADIKYDGERNIAVVRKDHPVQVVHFSRSGREADHMAGIFDEELLKIRDEVGYDFILDGERFAADFTQTMNAKKTGNDEAKKAMRIRAYFMMPLDHWLAQETDITMGQCRNDLGALLKKLSLSKIILSEGKIVNNHQDMMEYCNHVIDIGDSDGVKQEGLILKKLDDVYRWERNSAWTKIKRFYPVDGRIVGWYYGRKGSRLEKVMGGVIIEGVDEKNRKFRTRVGSGWSDEQRKDAFVLQDATIEASYQEMSQSASAKKAKSDIWQLRFPTVNRIRDDKDVPALQNERWWGITVDEAVKVCGA
jgi:DNA ligase-1